MGLMITGVLAWAALGIVSVDAQTERLGKVSFPSSCTPAAHAHFERGVAWLHSFAFSDAIKSFDAAAQADASCGIAHWGAAVAWLGNPLAGQIPPSRLKEGAAAVARGKAAGLSEARLQELVL
jgi:hypothetical protein